MGNETLMEHLAMRLGIEPGGTTADGIFTLLPCSCLGNCGCAPAIMIGETMYEKLTLENVEEILEKEKMSP